DDLVRVNGQWFFSKRKIYNEGSARWQYKGAGNPACRERRVMRRIENLRLKFGSCSIVPTVDDGPWTRPGAPAVQLTHRARCVCATAVTTRADGAPRTRATVDRSRKYSGTPAAGGRWPDQS